MPPVPPLSTGPTAGAAHRRGVAHLLQGRAVAAIDDLRRAVKEDPCFVLGHADLALALAGFDGGHADEGQRSLDVARACSRRVSLYEQHHAEVVALALGGRIARAAVLGMEHLAEYPDDEVVRFALARWCATSARPHPQTAWEGSP
jgi:hypothetical protein